MTSAPSARIVIAGAGIGGLATALALHGRGLRATVLESATDVRPLGVGINIQPAAIAELTALGLGEPLAATSIATREHRYLDHRGTTMWSEPRGIAGGHDAPQYSLHRGELQMMLLAAVRERLGEDAVRTASQVRGFDQSGDRVAVSLRTPAGGETVLEADALIGADGLHSAVRACLYPDEAPPRTTAVRMWRGLTELPEFIDGRTMIIASDDRASRIVAYPCSRRHADRGAVLLNWVCLAADEAFRGASQSGPGTAEQVLPHFAHWDLGCVDIRRMLASDTPIVHYPMVDRDPLPAWGEHRVTLLGDAAHPMYPIGANGATQAILDGVALAAELARDDDIPAALQRYESVRVPATTAIVEAARTMDHSERALAERHDTADVAAELREITSEYRAAIEGRSLEGQPAPGTAH